VRVEEAIAYKLSHHLKCLDQKDVIQWPYLLMYSFLVSKSDVFI